MDVGISLNLIYVETDKKLHIDPNKIKPSGTTFKGITPGIEAHSWGSITLGVVFSTPENI